MEGFPGASPESTSGFSLAAYQSMVAANFSLNPEMFSGVCVKQEEHGEDDLYGTVTGMDNEKWGRIMMQKVKEAEDDDAEEDGPEVKHNKSIVDQDVRHEHGDICVDADSTSGDCSVGSGTSEVGDENDADEPSKQDSDKKRDDFDDDMEGSNSDEDRLVKKYKLDNMKGETTGSDTTDDSDSCSYQDDESHGNSLSQINFGSGLSFSDADSNSGVQVKLEFVGDITESLMGVPGMAMPNPDHLSAFGNTTGPLPGRKHCCLICGKAFMRQAHVRRHMKSMHSGVKHFKCYHCDATFSSKSDLRVHQRSHDEFRSHTCPECGKGFHEKRDLNRHMVYHSGLRDFKCDLCNKDFLRKWDLKMHMMSHSGLKPFKCYICNRSFKLKKDMQRHLVTHTGQRPYKCLLCEKAYTQEYDLKCHTLVHTTNGRPHQCKLCDKSFLWKADLKRHLLRHEVGEKPHKCPICDKGFTRNNHMQNHLKIHEGLKPYSKKPRPFDEDLHKYMVVQEGERPFKCLACNKAYARKTHLSRHVRIHSGRKAYHCFECDKSFTRKSGLQKHMKIHSGDRPFKCEECERSFTTENGLKDHIVTHTGARPFQCPDCPKTFTKESALKQHSAVHSELRPYKCDTCERAFPRKGQLQIHMKVHITDKPYRCPICDRTFMREYNLRSHFEAHGRKKQRKSHPHVIELGGFTAFSEQSAIPSTMGLETNENDLNLRDPTSLSPVQNESDHVLLKEIKQEVPDLDDDHPVNVCSVPQHIGPSENDNYPLSPERGVVQFGGKFNQQSLQTESNHLESDDEKPVNVCD